jgi:hypothetical protein
LLCAKIVGDRMSQPTPESKAKWRKTHRRTWSADLTPADFDQLKQIQAGLSNAEFLKKIIEKEEGK